MNIGRQIKRFRKIHSLTLGDLSKMIEIPLSQMSKIERGIEGKNEAIIQQKIIPKIEELLNVNFKEAMKCGEEIESVFQDFLNMIYRDEMKYKRYLQLIEMKRDHYLKSADYYKIILIDYIIKVLQNNLEDIDLYELEIESSLEHNSLYELVYMDYKAAKYYLLNKYDEALLLSKKIPIVESYLKVHAMICYHRGLYYHYCNMYVEETECFSIAEKIFLDDFNYKRAVSCKLQIGNVHLRNRRYDLVLPIYDSCLSIKEDAIVDKETRGILLRNKAWVLILVNEYEKALDALSEANNIQQNHPNVILYKFWCYYCLNDYTSANNILKIGYFLQNDKTYCERYKLFRILLKSPKNDDKVIKQAKIVVNKIQTKKLYAILPFYLDILIKALKNTGRKDELISYLELRIKISEK